ncbi:hypothetical protein QQ045_014496 [Rhodiola kirilowii]
MKELEDFLEEKFKHLKLTTLDKNLKDKLIEEPNYKQVYQDQINKIQKWADSPTTGNYYYPRTTPADVLIEESNEIITNWYIGGHIYEWNIDGYANQQIHNAIHRMLMYSTVCKNNDRDDILNRSKQEGNNLVEDAVYTLVVSIIEHFTGNYSRNGESIRTLLQNLRQNHPFIPYENYTYGKLIGVCTQEGITLCNEIKLNQQLKRQSFMEKSQLGNFCDQFAIDKPFSSKPRKPKKDYTPYHKRKRFSKKKMEEKEERRYARKENKWQKNKSMTCHRCGKRGHFASNCWVKQKINNLEESDRIKKIISKILLNENSESELTDFSSTSEDLKVLRNENLNTDSDSDCTPCNQGQPCLKRDSENEEALYKMQSQFQYMEINMLSFKKGMELLEDVKDPELRLRINDQLDIVPGTSEKQEIPKDINKPYLINEVYRRISQITEIGKPTSTHDLIIEIDNLKKEIQHIKTNNTRLDQRISKIEKGKEVLTSHQDFERVGKDDNFLSTLEMFITQKWHVKITLLISNYYSKECTSLVDSGVDLNVIQEGLLPTRYFHKTTHTLFRAGGNNLQINYKLPKAKEGFDKYQVSTKARPCQTNSTYLEMCKEEIDTLLQKRLINPWNLLGQVQRSIFIRIVRGVKEFPGLIPSGKDSPPNKGGGNASSYKGGRGRGKKPDVLAQVGNKILVNMRQNNEYQKYLEYKRQNTTASSNEMPSYANIVATEDNEAGYTAYLMNQKQEVILLLEERDSQWSEKPWILMRKYMGEESYPSQMYKSQIYYENILKKTGCEVTHFSHQAHPEVYNYSKITIKKVISLQDYGISPLSKREFFFGQNKTPAKYNFWDYMDAFKKALLYDNPKHKHSWL